MSGPTAPCFAGLDLGTSALKGVALDDTGTERAHAVRPYRTDRPCAAAAEQDPADWVAASYEVLKELGRACAPAPLRAVGLSGMVPTLVTLNRTGEPTGPAITWEDGRAERFSPAHANLEEAQRLYELTGQWVDGRYLVPMFVRLAVEEPARASATSTMCSAKDYLFCSLTGELATDPSTAAGYGCYRLDARGGNGGYDRYDGASIERAAAASGRALPGLPPVLPSASVRPMRPALAAQLGLGDVAVCLGAADSVLGAVGVGATRPGSVAYLWGTSTVVLAPLDISARDPAHRFIVTPTLEKGVFGHEMDLLSTGSAVAWMNRLTGNVMSEGDLVALAAALEPGAGPVFLPYLAPGEQGALWDPALRGTFLGLELRHGPAEMARGLLSGIVLESRRCLDVLRGLCPVPLEVVATGGPTQNATFRQNLADAIGTPVAVPVPAGAGASARGAAMVAAAASAAALPAAPGSAALSVPSPEGTALWDDLWARHEEARLALTPIFRRWAAPRAGVAGPTRPAPARTTREAPC